MKIDNIYCQFKQVYDSLTEENWYSSLCSFLKFIIDYKGTAKEERTIAGWTAAICEKSFYLFVHNKTETRIKVFSSSLLHLFNSSDVPVFLLQHGSVVCGKRQPSIQQSLVPTLERYEVIERLPSAFNQIADAIIIGGSMSYAPFFSVRGNAKENDVSDIDAIVVVNANFFKAQAWKGFLANKLFPIQESKRFYDRAKVFKELYRNAEAEIISQRFNILGKTFTISPHFITLEALEKLIGKNFKCSLQSDKFKHYEIRDFRENLFTHPCQARHSFDGSRYESEVRGWQTDSGFISQVPGFTIDQGKYFPGAFHTVITPAFLVTYDSTGKTTAMVRKFEQSIYDEVARMRQINPLSSYPRAHNRYDIFAPGRYEQGRDSFISPRELRKFSERSSFTIDKVPSETASADYYKTGLQNSTDNRNIRREAKQKLANWKRRELRAIEYRIHQLLQGGHLEGALAKAREAGQQWFEAAFVETSHQQKIKLPEPYTQGGQVISEEILKIDIKPSELMRLKSYDQLSRVASNKKVFVRSMLDHGNQIKTYSLIIPVS